MFSKSQSLVLIFLLNINLISIQAQGDDADDDSLQVEMKSFDILSDSDKNWLDWNTLHLKKVGRNNFVLSGDIIFNSNFGKEQRVTLQITPYDPETQKRGAVVFMMDKDVCEFLEEDDKVYAPVMEVSNLPPKDSCPFPKGTYTIDNYSVNVDFLPKGTPKGDYIATLIFKDGVQMVSGSELHVTVS